MRSIGIDIGKRKCVVCVLSQKGDVLERAEYRNTAGASAEFAREMKRKYRRCQAACESTGNHWIKTFDAFEGAGIPIKLANPFKLKVISGADLKTDPVDAYKTAGALRTGVLPECYVPPTDVRADRQLVRRRISMVQDRTRVVNRARSLLHKYDVEIGASALYSAKAARLLSATELPDGEDNDALQQYARNMAYLNDEIKKIESTIRRRTIMNRYATLMMSIPGIDAFGALMLASEIVDVGRFGRPDRMVSWAGMCPRVSQSGDSTYYGRMKKASNRMVNWYLVQAAHTAVRTDPRMKAYFERVMKRHAGRRPVSIPHVAHKMIHIIWHMLSKNEPYAQRNEDLYSRKLMRLGRG